MDDKPLPFAGIILQLMQKIIYSDSKEWKDLQIYHHAIRNYLRQIGLDLHFDDVGGFAYITQPEAEDASSALFKLPRLTRRIKLNYPITILCVLLRERLGTHEAKEIDSDFYVSRDEIYDMMRVFLRDNPNEKRLTDKIDQYIKQLLEMEFLQESKTHTNRYRVRPILKARVNSEKLLEIKKKLQQFQGDLSDDE